MDFKFNKRYEYLIEIIFGNVSRYIIISKDTPYTIIKSTRYINVYSLYYGSGDDLTFVYVFNQDEYNKFISFIIEKSRVETIEYLLV